MEAKTHELKVWKQFFDALVTGEKTFELRKNDRDYKVGDKLILKDYDPDQKSFTGWEISCTVTYVLQGGQFGLEDGYCTMGLEVLKNNVK